MKIFILFFLFLIIQVDLRRHNDNDDNDNVSELDNKNNDHKSHSNKEFLQELSDDDQDNAAHGFLCSCVVAVLCVRARPALVGLSR